MKLCILHLGSEKTGTSSIQKYFSQHRADVLREGVWYPKAFTNSNGHVHIRLSDAAVQGTLDKNAPVAAEFREEIEARSRDAKACLFSSEFFHSELRENAQVARLHKFLRGFFDEIRLIYYARRQDQMLASMHSTAVQGGWTTNRAALSVYATKGHYYFDHNAVCDLWAGEFGREALTCRVFERDKLSGGDIVDDLRAAIGLPRDEKESRLSSNESLSFETICVLLALNGSRHKDNKELRKRLIATGRQRGGKRVPMLTKDEAKAFLAKFDEANRAFFARYVDPRLATGFAPGFESFPDAMPDPPPAEELLSFVFSKKAMKRSLPNIPTNEL